MSQTPPNEAKSPLETDTPARTPFRQCAPDHTRVRMHIAFDGTDFNGWQRQTKLPSIQGTIEKALSIICGKPILALGASRTDSGVHALRQVAHFDCPRDPESFHDLRYSLQSMTPPSIVVEEMFVAPRDFHAIASVRDKDYSYRVLNRVVPNPIEHRYSHWVRFPLDLDFLNEASQFLVGRHDFKSFQSSGTEVQTTVRQINSVRWNRLENDILEFAICGDGFLKQMVRNIVGTLIDLNQNGLAPRKIQEILDLQDRRKAGVTAPPQGLFLKRVNYPESIDIKCRKF